MKPSAEIEKLAIELWQKGVDPHHSGAPSVADYISAIVHYLDKQYELEQQKKEIK